MMPLPPPSDYPLELVQPGGDLRVAPLWYIAMGLNRSCFPL